MARHCGRSAAIFARGGVFVDVLKRWGRNGRGNATLVFGLVAPAIIGITGLSVDAVSWYLSKRELQVVADTAAITAAHVLYYAGDAAQAKSAGEAEVANQLSDRLASASVDVTVPPTSGAYAGDVAAAAVRLDYSHPLYFAGVVFGAQATIAASAVAKRISTGAQCILALDKTASRAVEFSGSASISLGCGVMSNSNDPESLYIGGSSTLDVAQVTAVGDIHIDGSATLNADHPLSRYRQPRPIPMAPTGVICRCRRALGRASATTWSSMIPRP